MNTNTTISNHELLLCWYFSITPKEVKNKTKVMEACAKRAYKKDIPRTLKYTVKTSQLRKKLSDSDSVKYQAYKEHFIDSVVKYICTSIKDELFDEEVIKNLNCDKFDTWHRIHCEKITSDANDTYVECDDKKIKLFDVFYIGQAQKLLNMTLNYMLVTGLWEDELSGIKKYLHAPIDDYILEAIKTEKELIKTTNEFQEPWSKWEKYDEYMEVQKYIRDNHKEADSLIEWEQKAWTKVAENRRKREEEKENKHRIKYGP